MPKWTAKLPMPSAYFELALREFGTTAESEAALRDGTGVTPDEAGDEITLGQQLQQVRNLNRLQPPGWALGLGSRFDAATHGPVGFAAVSAATMADSLAVIERFAHVRTPYFRFQARRDAQRLALRVDERVRLAAEERIPMIETLMLSVQRLVESVLHRRTSEASFHFAYAPPPYADRYAEYFHGAVRFDAAHTLLAIPSPWLRVKCPMADPVMYATSMRKLEALERRLEGDDHVVARVEQLIAARNDSSLSLEQVAARIHVSSRTLIRRLKRAGTTYHELLDTHRREQAEALLGNPDFDIAEIGYQLGYGEPANFGRACRRWFGMAPSRYRRRMLEG